MSAPKCGIVSHPACAPPGPLPARPPPVPWQLLQDAVHPVAFLCRSAPSGGSCGRAPPPLPSLCPPSPDPSFLSARRVLGVTIQLQNQNLLFSPKSGIFYWFQPLNVAQGRTPEIIFDFSSSIHNSSQRSVFFISKTSLHSISVFPILTKS